MTHDGPAPSSQPRGPGALAVHHPDPEEINMPDQPEPTNPADTVTVHYADVECDDGENLRTLATGDYLELSEPAAGMTPGTWQVVAWRGEDPAFPDEAVMRPVATAEVLELRRAAAEKLAAITGGTR